MSEKDKIQQILNERLEVSHMVVVDESHLHAGHVQAQKSGGGHFSVFIVSTDFIGMSLISRHRMINQALREEFQSAIHALSIHAQTPEEYNKSL